MKTRNWLILLGILIAIPVGWYLISPLFTNKTVDEEFPTVQATEAMEKGDEGTSPPTRPMTHAPAQLQHRHHQSARASRSRP
ncbi:MAG TPA: hypothetical protein VI451_22080, partial [Anaerolineales bacterium]|nr:hypothetical protein [Anaerolineales bacterium]